MTAADAAVAGVDTDIHISEVFADGGASSGQDAAFSHDFIELTNTGSQDETLTGWVLKDDTDSHAYPIDDGTVVPAGGYVSFNVDDTAHTAGNFGIGKSGDAARLYHGSTLIDQVWFSAAAGDGNDLDRCSIGSGAFAFVVATGITPGAANNCPSAATALATVKAQVKVNEVLADGTGTGNSQQLDSIELYNTGATSVPLAGWWLSDDKASDKDVLPAGTIIAPVGVTGTSPTRAANYLTYAVGASATSTFLSQDIFLDSSGNNLPGNKDFGIGKGGDNAALVAPDGTDADRVIFGSDTPPAVAAPATGNTISRCPDGTGSWALSFTATLGVANVCANPTDSIVKINEVDLAQGVLELLNTSSTASANVAGFTLSDTAVQSLAISAANTTVAGSAATTIPAGGYAEVSLGTAVTPVAAGDKITLADGADTADSTTWTSAFAPSWGRCPDGTGSFAQTAAATDGAAGTTAGVNACSTPTSGYDNIRVSEIETNGDPLGDWIELTNTGDTAVNISGLYLADNGGTQGAATVFPTDSSHYWQIPGTNQNPTDTTTAGNLVLPAHGYHAFFESNTFPFGLGNPDQARIFSPTKTLIDATSWPLHESGVTYERCPGVTQGVEFTDTADNAAFIDSSASSPNAANDCTPPIRINEVQASDPTGAPDWVELTNTGSQPVDLSGWVITDDKDSDGDVIPSGVVVNPGAFASFEVNNENGQFTSPSKPFGLGASGDEVRLYEAGAWNGTAYVASVLVDAFVFEDTSTKVGGAIQPQTVLADGVTKAGGAWPVNSASPTSPETYARCYDGVSQVVADGTGAWTVTSTATLGASNQCNGLFAATAWPDTHHGQAVTTADNVDLGQNMSGLFYVGGDPTTTADDYMWGIQNGTSGLSGANHGDPGSLYKLVPDVNGAWGPAPGWEKGVPVRYLNNATGEPDSEGVTAVNGKVYVTSERDNTNDTVSKIAVLEVDPTNVVAQNGDADGDLNATRQWDLGSDLGPNPGVNPETGLDPNNPGDANLGLEAVSFVPDAALTSAGFKDEHTGAAYNPSNYPNHVDGGVFFVGLEKTGKLYGYVFNSDNTFTRVATISTGFQTIQDLLWDPSQGALWATCDNGCQGRSSILKIDTNADAHQGTFQIQTVYSRPIGATQNLNNEGFAVQPSSECVNGSKLVFWSDDSDDGGHWLRSASVDCTPATLESMTVAPAAPSLVIGASAQLTATGQYSDGSTQDLTSQATWTTGDASVATVSNAAGSEGLLTGVALGSTTATATLGLTSGSTSVTVTKAATTVTLASTADPAVVGQSGQITATVATVSPGTGVPTGSVTLTVDGTVRGSALLSGGQASVQLSALGIGVHTLTVSYAGDSGHAGSLSDAFTQTITKAATTVTLASTADPAVVGQSGQITATVATVSPGTGVPMGSVTLTVDGKVWGSGLLSGGKASVQLSALGVGVHTLTVSYAGDSGHAGSLSDAFTQTITKAATTVTLTSTANPAPHGQSGQITATVATVSPGTGVPTGTVAVTIDGAPGGSATLSGGKASMKLSALSVGSHTVVVTYSGDAGRNGSTSAPFTQTIS